jgi:hypothetical protein
MHLSRLLRRVRAAVVIGLTWAVAWAVVGGALMEGIVDPHGRIIDMWPQTLAIPGFLGGALFSLVLGIAARRRRFDELSITRSGLWGALAGLLVGALVAASGIAARVEPPWLRVVMIIGPLTLLSAASASASLWIARRAERRIETPS